VWHRLVLDACLPPGTRVDVSSRAADDPADLAGTPWSPEPAPYRRGDGSELPFVPGPAASGEGTWELLFQAARGRYLQIQLQLVGNGRSTPRVRALRAYYPRFSYLNRYLPAAYRDDPTSASFLDRFLANIEGFFTATEDRIAAARVLFDVRSAPAEALDWLAGWYAVALDPAWDEPRRRLFLAHAPEFFRCRGTIRGLTLTLRLALDPCVDASLFDDPSSTPGGAAGPVRIVEGYRRRTVPGVVLGDPTEVAPAVAAQPVRWAPSQGRAALNRRYAGRAGGARGRSARFPLRAPCDAAAAATWRQFAADTLGFVPSATAGDAGAWADFLARRYKTVEALNAAYAPAKFAAFADVPLPAAPPADGPPLADWYAFETVVLAVRRTAHQFTVLIPAPADNDPAELRRRLDLMARVVDLEKPAHTTFDVKFYRTLFRVGAARLGNDTVLDPGGGPSRSFGPAVLGRDALAGSALAPRPPQDAADRAVVGRDRLAVGNPPLGKGQSNG
jgi:phage tail-like protein